MSFGNHPYPVRCWKCNTAREVTPADLEALSHIVCQECVQWNNILGLRTDEEGRHYWQTGPEDGSLYDDF